MLSNLFDDPSNETSTKSTTNSSNFKRAPSVKRNETNLSGIINQGSTCYLNSLLQTLLFTREFRDNLFSLSDEELGIVPSKTGQQVKLRIIPVELQRLFAQMLLLDQEACSTNRLTDSFGWTNSEELQQHDVQELNRILFSAIEQSLINTKQSKLIQNLYRGTYINKIKCLSCLNIFEREEEFLDLQTTVQNSPSLEASLSNSFILRENLNGNNQYKCEKCNNQYRDAEKYCQIKTLPPILTLSLLRFTYDLNTFQRIKETSRFEFPFELNLKDYMEDSIKTKINNEETLYELFSVVIHSGSAYGGHYHCYIKDLDNLGKWTLSDKITDDINKKNQSEIEKNLTEIPKEIILICSNDDENSSRNNKDLVNLDYLKYEKPLELLKAFIYNRNKNESFKIENLCVDLTKETGVSWNKRFKNSYGPIEKFLRKHDDTFEISSDGKSVRLKEHEIKIVSSNAINEIDNQTKKNKGNPEKEEQNLSEEDLSEFFAQNHWYDFNDTRVTPIFSSQIKKQFEGNESAYMLFYRKKTQQQTCKNLSDKIPKWLLDEIEIDNKNLRLKKEEYEKSLNTINVECYLESDFNLVKSVLNLKHNYEGKSFWLTFDKRSTTVGDLTEILVKYCTEEIETKEKEQIQERKEKYLELLFDEHVSYWLLLEKVDINSNGRFNYYVKSNLSNSNEPLSKFFESNSNLVIVLSKHLDNWPIGEDYKPIIIFLKYFDSKFEIKQLSYTFTRNTLIKQVKEELGSYLVNEQSSYQLGLTDEEIKKLSCLSYTFSLVRSKPTSIINKNDDVKETIVLDSSIYDDQSLKDLSVQNGDIITIESENCMNELLSTKTISQKQNTMFSNRLIKVNIINFLFVKDNMLNGIVPTNELFIEESDSIKNMRVMALSSFEIQLPIDESHLRFLTDEDLGSSDSFLANMMMQNLSLEPENFKNFLQPIEILYDDSILGEIIEPVLKKFDTIDEPKLTFLLCPGRAPNRSNGEVVLKCFTDKKLGENFIDIFVNPNYTVLELTNMICDKLNLEEINIQNEEVYYLKKLDFLGDVESVLNNLELKCSDANFKNNQTVQITKGILIPPNSLKIKIWQINNITQTNEDLNVILNDFIEQTFKDFKLIKEIIVSNDIKLEELKTIIENFLAEREQLNVNFRLRMLKKIVTGDFRLDREIKFYKKKALIDWHKSLKQLHMGQECDIGVELLDNEDAINQGIMLLNCIRFDLNTRLCSKNSFKQISWNINNGATYASLKDSVLKSYPELDSLRFHLAKRFFDKYQWIVLRDFSTDTQAQKNKKKAKNGSQQGTNKSNLKQAPFNLDDGDLIAFTIPDQTDTSFHITPQHFMSTEDLEIMNKKNITAAEISRIRKERKNGDENIKKTKTRNRPEVGISIKIDDFTKDF